MNCPSKEKANIKLFSVSVSYYLYLSGGGEEGSWTPCYSVNTLPASQTLAITRFALSNDGVKNILSAFEIDTKQPLKIVK